MARLLFVFTGDLQFVLDANAYKNMFSSISLVHSERGYIVDVYKSRGSVQRFLICYDFMIFHLFDVQTLNS